jgi:hemolysin activation/secretion protein
VGLDNIGNKSTGEYRAPLSLNINSPFMLGDKITLSTLYTNQDMWLGSLNYDLPIGYSGWRGQLGYAHTSYLLAGAFASLEAKGYADVTTAKLSYPLIRSQASNVQLAFGYQHKKLEDKYQALGSTQSKTSESLPLSLQFDHRDSWLLGGGVTYGLASLTSGTMHLGQSMLASDASTARTQGNFSKANLDIARIQKLSSRFNLYLRYSGQWASKNLDSSEKFGLGGFYGVRAYPQGEGMGDFGWLTQLELRYEMGNATPSFCMMPAVRIATRAHGIAVPPSSASCPLLVLGCGSAAQPGRWNPAWPGKPRAERQLPKIPITTLGFTLR